MKRCRNCKSKNLKEQYLEDSQGKICLDCGLSAEQYVTGFVGRSKWFYIMDGKEWIKPKVLENSQSNEKEKSE